jgi:hypothetical protein
MYDQNAERIADLMQAERLARIPHNERIREAEAARRRQHGRVLGERWRVAVARLLIALAQRITPPVRRAPTSHAGAISG